MESFTAAHEEAMLARFGLLTLCMETAQRIDWIACDTRHICTSLQPPLSYHTLIDCLQLKMQLGIIHTRVHLQILQWINSTCTTVANPQEWCWKEYEQKYIPIATDIDIGPAEIMKVVCCKCRSDSWKPCGGQNCTCNFYRLSCTTICKNCYGTLCENRSAPSINFSGDQDDLVGVDVVQETAPSETVDEVVFDDEYPYVETWRWFWRDKQNLSWQISEYPILGKISIFHWKISDNPFLVINCSLCEIQEIQ